MWRRVWIWERKLKKGKTYCLRWHDDEGRIRTETIGPDRKLVEWLRDERQRELNNGRLTRIRRISYGQFKEQELELMKGRLAERSLADLEQTLERFGQVCGDRMLANISPRMVEEYFSARLQTVSPATANKDLRTLKAAFNRAIGRGHLERNPAVGLKQVREPEKRIRVLSADEIGRLLCACHSVQWKALVALGVTTGMRLGEMLALRWEDIDLAHGTIWVGNRPGHLTKSRRSRVLGLVPEIRDLLKRMPRKGQFVFHTREGRPWRNNVQSRFRKIVKRAGIKRCTLHDLRRTFISHLAMAGVNEAVVQKLAGHASFSTTLKYYTHITPQSLRSAQAQLPFSGILKDISDTYHEPSKTHQGERARVIRLPRPAS